MAKLEIPPIKVIPINDMKDAAALVEQLNGLIVNYNNILTTHKQNMFLKNEQITESVTRVLGNIEKAIDAICLRLSKYNFITETESYTTQH